jgi:hypothetical protein
MAFTYEECAIGALELAQNTVDHFWPADRPPAHPITMQDAMLLFPAAWWCFAGESPDWLSDQTGTIDLLSYALIVVAGGWPWPWVHRALVALSTGADTPTPHVIESWLKTHANNASTMETPDVDHDHHAPPVRDGE